MKSVRDTTGRFVERPHYEPAELDRECELIIKGFLKRLHGEVRFPISTDDLTKLVESEAESLDLYADLTEFGVDTEGATEFLPRAKPRVYINRELSADLKRENRLRTTLTHEFGHVHYHAYLWDMNVGQLTLAPVKTDTRQVCKRSTMLDARPYDWMEWQAGHVCGAVLMPASDVRTLAAEYVEACGLFGPIGLGGAHEAALVDRVVESYRVSRDAARIRLLRLGVLAEQNTSRSLFS